MHPARRVRGAQRRAENGAARESIAPPGNVAGKKEKRKSDTSVKRAGEMMPAASARKGGRKEHRKGKEKSGNNGESSLSTSAQAMLARSSGDQGDHLEMPTIDNILASSGESSKRRAAVTKPSDNGGKSGGGQVMLSGKCINGIARVFSSQLFIGKWYVDVDHFKYNTPSRRVGVSVDEEKKLLWEALMWIDKAGKEMKLYLFLSEKAKVYLHRFYLVTSIKEFNTLQIAACCLFLAKKKSTIGVQAPDTFLDKLLCRLMGVRDLEPILANPMHLVYKKSLLENKDILEKTLGQDVDVEISHDFLRKSRREGEFDAKLYRLAYQVASDLNMQVPSMVCRYSAKMLAAMAIYFAADYFEIKLPSEWSYRMMSNEDGTNGTINNISGAAMEKHIERVTEDFIKRKKEQEERKNSEQSSPGGMSNEGGGHVDRDGGDDHGGGGGGGDDNDDDDGGVGRGEDHFGGGNHVGGVDHGGSVYRAFGGDDHVGVAQMFHDPWPLALKMPRLKPKVLETEGAAHHNEHNLRSLAPSLPKASTHSGGGDNGDGPSTSERVAHPQANAAAAAPRSTNKFANELFEKLSKTKEALKNASHIVEKLASPKKLFPKRPKYDPRNFAKHPQVPQNVRNLHTPIATSITPEAIYFKKKKAASKTSKTASSLSQGNEQPGTTSRPQPQPDLVEASTDQVTRGSSSSSTKAKPRDAACFRSKPISLKLKINTALLTSTKVTEQDQKKKKKKKKRESKHHKGHKKMAKKEEKKKSKKRKREQEDKDWKPEKKEKHKSNEMTKMKEGEESKPAEGEKRAPIVLKIKKGTSYFVSSSSSAPKKHK